MRNLFLAVLVLVPGCSNAEVPVGSLPPIGKADGNGVLVYGLYEESTEAIAILRVANTVERDVLDGEAELTSSAAASIVAERPFASLEELAAAEQVGPQTVRRLFRYADLNGFLTYRSPIVVHGRVVAIGDLHGDFERTREALVLAGAIDDRDRWIGEDLIVVQVGDQLDRGDGEASILALLERLADEAEAAGGALIALIGNHETMNVEGDLRYVTEAGQTAFGPSRAEALQQGSSVARLLARHDVIANIDGTLFSHAGVLPQHVEYGLAEINHETRAWMIFEDLDPPAFIDAEDGPVWYRGYGTDADTDCALVDATLAATGAERIVVAHTVQEAGITSACDERLFRVDVGLSAYYGGPIEVLELDHGVASVLYYE